MGARPARADLLLRALGAAYQYDLDDRAWLGGLSSVVDELVGRGGGTVAYRYEAAGAGLRLSGGVDYESGSAPKAHIFKRMDDALRAKAIDGILRRVDVRMLERAFLAPLGPGPLHLLTEQMAEQLGEPGLAVRMPIISKLTGDRDSWGISAPDARGGGMVICCPQPDRAHRTAGQVAAMRQLQCALGPAQRLRAYARNASLSASIEAVMAGDGKVLDARGPAREFELRERLTRAVRRWDAARATPARGLWDGEAIWPGLVEGRWSLVERIDRDGKRLIVAHANAPGTRSARALTAREREVAEHVAAGLSNKEVAAKLGWSEATVAEDLRMALLKLGARSRLDLILDYARAPTSLAYRVGAFSAAEPIVAVDEDIEVDLPAALTPAQREVARLMLSGLSNRQIAKRRCTMERTVANQIQQIFEICNVHTRHELLAAVLREGGGE